jgi:DHA1 family multidrug resistance protein-like MFS transporter
LRTFGAGKSSPPSLHEREEIVAEFDGHDDLLHAMIWLIRQKLATAAIPGFTTLKTAFGSLDAQCGDESNSTTLIARICCRNTEFIVLRARLCDRTDLWTLLSELRGRQFAFVVASFGFNVFNLAVVTGKDLQTVLTCLFFSASSGACPLAAYCQSSPTLVCDRALHKHVLDDQELRFHSSLARRSGAWVLSGPPRYLAA